MAPAEGSDGEEGAGGRVGTPLRGFAHPTSRAPDIRQGFVYERAPHITLKSIANNAEIDVIWEIWQRTLEPLRGELNAALRRVGKGAEGAVPTRPPEIEEVTWARSALPTLQEGVRRVGKGAEGDVPTHPSAEENPRGHASLSPPYEEWQVPRDADPAWPDAAKRAHAGWWEARIARQKEIDASIAKAADVELLYDRPYEDKSKVRVAGPFTVESLSPHRVVTSRDDTLGPEIAAAGGAFQREPKSVPEADFGAMVLENLRAAGLHQKDKADAIKFSSLEPWPGEWIAAEGRYADESGRERRAGIFIGPEFGTVTRADLTAGAREASEARFDVLIACAFSYAAHASELNRLGPLAILKARMNPDLHMAEDLKTTSKGNLFVVFGEPDIDILDEPEGMIRVKVNGIDVFDPSTGEIRSDDTKGIACWFIDTDYNEESFFVRHAYFLGANDPYKSLKTALRTEIDEDAWATLYRDTSRPFARPKEGRIAVKVINHFGDEVLKVFWV